MMPVMLCKHGQTQLAAWQNSVMPVIHCVLVALWKETSQVLETAACIACLLLSLQVVYVCCDAGGLLRTMRKPN